MFELTRPQDSHRITLFKRGYTRKNKMDMHEINLHDAPDNGLYYDGHDIVNAFMWGAVVGGAIAAGLVALGFAI